MQKRDSVLYLHSQTSQHYLLLAARKQRQTRYHDTAELSTELTQYTSPRYHGIQGTAHCLTSRKPFYNNSTSTSYTSTPNVEKNSKFTKGIYILKTYLLISELENTNNPGTPYLS